MTQKNEISLVVPAESLAKINEALKTLGEEFNTLLISLTANQRQILPKMGDGTLAFVTKTIGYTDTNPEFIPSFLNVADLQVDMAAIQSLLPIAHTIEQFNSMLQDTLMLCGSEAYIAALIYYQAVKSAAKNNIPHSKEIRDDLGERFPGKPKPKKDDNTPNP